LGKVNKGLPLSSGSSFLLEKPVFDEASAKYIFNRQKPAENDKGAQTIKNFMSFSGF
jgi:hypothetical protein